MRLNVTGRLLVVLLLAASLGWAAPTLRIREVRAELGTRTLVLRGAGFVSAANPTPTVTLADVPLSVMAATEGEILVRLPEGLEAGSYRVRVLRGAQTVSFDVAVAPAAPLGEGDITAVLTSAGGGLRGGSDTGDVSLSLVPCAAGQLLKSSGAGWACAVDANTGVNAVVNGGGITGALAGQWLTLGSTATSASVAFAIVARDHSRSFSAASIGLAGRLDLPKTTSASVGVINKGGSPFLHDFGKANAFFGLSAGNFSLTGVRNTAVGTKTLGSLSSGSDEAAVGDSALMANTAGNGNSAFGSGALLSNTTGSGNSAFGYQALASNSTGAKNSAFGYQALQSNTTGSRNSAFGEATLQANTEGNGNSGFGLWVLQFNTTGSYNSAFGRWALRQNTTGERNSAFGHYALDDPLVGSENAAFGAYARGTEQAVAIGPYAGVGADSSPECTFVGHDTGWPLIDRLDTEQSILLGDLAGRFFSLGARNIFIGNLGANVSDTMGIGSSGVLVPPHVAVYVAGISKQTSPDGVPVFVERSGSLGTLTSSRRYKEEIADMDAESGVLTRLRPVSFYYRPELDATHTRQYGLVAEEVAEQAPELVVRDETGAPETVRYHFVNAMLLNELQRQHRQLEAQDHQLEAQDRQFGAQKAELQELKDRVSRLAARVSDYQARAAAARGPRSDPSD